MKDSNILAKFSMFFPKMEDRVIAISRDGRILNESLDEMPYNHATLTNHMAFQLGFSYSETSFPLIAGCDLAEQGVLVLHIRREGSCICFFPIDITSIQYHLFKEILNQHDEWEYQYIGCIQEEGYVSREHVLDYAKRLVCEDKTSFYSRKR